MYYKCSIMHFMSINNPTTIKTLRVRVKDNKSKTLNNLAFDVNQIWNAVNAESAEYGWVPIPGVGWINPGGNSGYDYTNRFNSIRKERGLNIGSSSYQQVILEHERKRKQFKTNKLKWRTSGGSRRSLGWIPTRCDAVKFKNGQLKFNGHYFKIWDSYGLSNYKFKGGCFSQDARGRWYFNVAVEVKQNQSKGKGHIGVDLGLKTIVVCSDGTSLENKRFFRSLEKKLGNAQRANKKKLVKTIHAKIKNSRKDAIHKFTTNLVNNNELIVVGDVRSSKIAKTKMAKSVLDAGWYMLKTQLDYKSKAMRVVYVEVNERNTSRTCSSCGEISGSSPKGMDGLGIREWTCMSCNTKHDRDINAAKNILALGHESLAGGISTLNSVRD